MTEVTQEQCLESMSVFGWFDFCEEQIKRGLGDPRRWKSDTVVVLSNVEIDKFQFSS